MVPVKWWNRERRIYSLTVHRNALQDELKMWHRQYQRSLAERAQITAKLVAAEDKLRHCELVKDGYIEDLIRAGTTITELQAALDLASTELQATKGHPS